MTERKATMETVASLSTLEKASLLSGENIWQTRDIPREGVRSLFLADGPHGVRKQLGSADHLGLNESQPATCFPTAATIANSWDRDLAERVGGALGAEAASLGVDVLLGPGLNIKRSPLCGRNFEYFSEDPYLTGMLGAAFVRGIQSAGIAACPKHFAVNSQETRRMTSNSIIDEATLREIYLTAFEIVVTEGQPLTIMSSYNRINGVYANEHPHLLRDILRDEWGFDGAVITDWGGGNDPIAAIAAGGTLEMPSPGFDSVSRILNSSEYDASDLDARVAEVIDLAARINPVETSDADVLRDNDTLAQHAAEQGAVLLKNEGSLLPLSSDTTVAVIGEFAFTPRYQGSGSSRVRPTRLQTPIEALQASNLRVVASEPGFAHGEPSSQEKMDRAKDAARGADVALVYLGLDEVSESEGKDRDHLELPRNQQELLAAVASVNPRVAVVFSAGSPVTMPWLGDCQALVHGYLAGQAGAEALVRILTGEVNPSGRLAETYPLALDDTPTAENFPSEQPETLYIERLYVGYRYYSSANKPVLFPFGYGLSYTHFDYSGLKVTDTDVTFTVTNVGSLAGADVPQLYIGPSGEATRGGVRPAIELKGFTKVQLGAGQSREVTIPFDRYTFRAYSAVASDWVTFGGTYDLWIGHNALDRPLHAPLTVAAAGDVPSTSAAHVEVNSEARVHQLTREDFARLSGRELPAETPVEGRRLLHENSPMSDLQYAQGVVGRAIYSLYFKRSLRRAERKGVPNLDLLFQYGMPFRTIAKMSGGMANSRMVERILQVVNGHFFRGAGGLVTAFFANRKYQSSTRKELARRVAAGSDYEGNGR